MFKSSYFFKNICYYVLESFLPTVGSERSGKIFTANDSVYKGLGKHSIWRKIRPSKEEKWKLPLPK